MKATVFALRVLILSLAGCVAQPPAQPPAQPEPDDCRASELQGLAGQPGTVLAGMRFSQVLRVIEYGMPVTMDYNPARLNIELDRRGVIERVSCG